MSQWIRYLFLEVSISVSNSSLLISFLLPFIVSIAVVTFVLQGYYISGQIHELSGWHIIGIMFGFVCAPIQSAVFNKVSIEYNSGILAQKFMQKMSRFSVILIDNIVDVLIFAILFTFLCITILTAIPDRISIHRLIVGICILIPTIVCTTRLYSIILTKNALSAVVGVVSFIAILPSLMISGSIVSSEFLSFTDLSIGISYCMFCVVTYSLISWLMSIYVEIAV